MSMTPANNRRRARIDLRIQVYRRPLAPIQHIPSDNRNNAGNHSRLPIFTDPLPRDQRPELPPLPQRLRAPNDDDAENINPVQDIVITLFDDEFGPVREAPGVHNINDVTQRWY
jgi:hypothetical protein